MTNLYSERHFKHTAKSGKEYDFWCYYQSTQSGFRHLCYNYPLIAGLKSGYLYDRDYLVKHCWCNRTWEHFTYETVLKNAIENLNTTNEDKQELIDVLIKGTIKEEENTKQFLQDFENTYKRLPDKVKQSLKNSDILLETEEQAKDLLQSMKLINAISEVL